MVSPSNFMRRIEELNAIGIALSTEKDHKKLLEMILERAMRITHADGGTLYLVDEARFLKFEIVRTLSKEVAFGGPSGQTVPFQPIPLYHEIDLPDTRTIAAYAALSGQRVNIKDAYATPGFDFSGVIKFDQKYAYHTRSLLTIPMKNHENEVIGVLQLINALDDKNHITPFSKEDQQLVASLASQAAVALTNQQLINDMRVLLETFIEVIANAIDEKSPYTGGHCRRVPSITMLLAAAVQETNGGPLREVHFSEEQLYELKIAALLHDCGKITTPIHVVDKATKLETIFDRIHLIDARLEILRRDAEIALLKRQLATPTPTDEPTIDAEAHYQHSITTLNQAQECLHLYNLGSEFMPEEARARVTQIGQMTWQTYKGETRPLLSEEELYNLTIPKGTLTPQERNIINHHIVATINMLESLPFPKHLRNVPEIAGGHHERMDGKGYPKGLTREAMSLQARIMGIADIFEALTAADRPYKRGMPLSQALSIMGKMRLEGHIDPDLFDVFIQQQVYLEYAKEHLKPEQIDIFDPADLPGCNVLPPSAVSV